MLTGDVGSGAIETEGLHEVADNGVRVVRTTGTGLRCDTRQWEIEPWAILNGSGGAILCKLPATVTVEVTNNIEGGQTVKAWITSGDIELVPLTAKSSDA